MGKSTAKSLAIGNPADLGASHVERHSKERRYLPRGAAPVETLHGKHLAGSDEIYDAAMELAHEQGMMNRDEWFEWNEKRAKKRGRNNVHKDYDEYKAAVSAKVAVRMSAKEKAVQMKNKGMALESGLYYVASVEDYYNQGLVDHNLRVLDAEKLQRHREFEGATLKALHDSPEYRTLHDGLDVQAEIHYGEDGAVHLQTLGVMGQTTKNRGNTSQYEIAPTKVKEERLRLLLGDDVFEKEMYREKVVRTRRKDDSRFVPTRRSYDKVDMSKASEVSKKGKSGDVGYNQLVKQLWWRVHQDKMEDIALEKSKEYGVEWRREYGSGKVEPTRNKSDYRTHTKDKLAKRELDKRIKKDVAYIQGRFMDERSEIDADRAVVEKEAAEKEAALQEKYAAREAALEKEYAARKAELEEEFATAVLLKEDELQEGVAELEQQRAYLADGLDRKIQAALSAYIEQNRRTPTAEEIRLKLLKQSMSRHEREAIAGSKNKPTHRKGHSGYDLS